MNNQFYNIKVLKAKNLESVFVNNPSYKKTGGEVTPVYEFTPDSSLNYDIYENGKIIGKYESTRIYISVENYAFIVTGYEYKLCMESAEIVEKMIFNTICEENRNLPEAEILNHILNNYKEDSITLVEPENQITQINLKNSEEVQKFITGYKDGDFGAFYLYSFDTNMCEDSDVLQQLKTITECGFLDPDIQPDIPYCRINDSLYQISGKAGAVIVMRGQKKYRFSKWGVARFLKGLQQTISIESETVINNQLLDEGLEKIKDIESLKSTVLKNLRKIVHIRNEIKQSKNRDIEGNIYANYMENGPLNNLIDDFEESCNSIKDELEVEMDRRESKRSSMFDKTLAIIGIMALVSAFKDGSDLNITGLEMFNNPIMLGFIDLIKVASPIICLVLIVILVIFVFRKK